MEDQAEIRNKVNGYLESIKCPADIYKLFKNLNYPEECILDPSYTKKIREFGFAKDERKKINKIYTVLTYDKLNVFLLETKSLTRPFVRYVAKAFANMYMKFLLILTVDYKEIQIVFPDYEKKEVGKHKLKTTTLAINTDGLYYTDIYIISKIALAKKEYTWRDIWIIWKEAFNVNKVTEKFFEDYKRIFFIIRKYLKKQKVDTKTAHEFTLQFLNRVMFIYFISKKGWLNNNLKFMKTFWETYKKVSKYGNNEFYSKWLQPLFFEAFNNKLRYNPEFPEEVNRMLLITPYLNGGLFTAKEGLDNLNITLSDNLFKEIFKFFESYNFTIKEDSVLDIEVSVDPQMIGYVYESLANVAENVYEKEEDLRGDWGVFYTARVEVDFMCRRSLVEYLAKHLDIPKEELYELVFDENKEKIEKKFNQRRCWHKIEDVLDNISVVDPACGSGAFLVGMLNVIIELYQVIYKYTKTNLNDFQAKYRVIQRSLYGVDVMPWAIHASELRLWLQLVVETDFKEDELKKYPLLPNLNMNLRVGDSLVQEIGGISFNVRSNNLKPYLKKKLDELKQEKSKYFENSLTAKYKTPQAFEKQKIKLFEEILDERIEALENDNTVLANSEKKKEKQTGLFGAQINIEAQNIQKEKKKLAEIEKPIERNEKEINKLKKVKELLRDPEKKPFIWDMDFAEVFSDKGGFDIVIGNPPYVRQEKIAPPEKIKADITLEDRKEYKEKLINSVKNRFYVIDNWDKKSDLYIYFYFHGLSLLNKEGVFTFITSNSWLDVGYGKILQEFLLRYSHVIGIYDNQAKRSFEHADVNTIIALLGAPVLKSQRSLFDYGITSNKNIQNTYLGFNQTAKFIMFKKPFEETINSKNMIDIEKAKETTKTDDYRVYCKNQEELLEEGWEYPEGFDSEKEHRFSKGKFAGDKWGGKYLRAPDIYFTILEKGKDNLVKLGDIAKVRFGIKTGVNEFFYLDKETQKKWKIEKEFLKPVIKSPRESKIIDLNNVSLKYKLLMCHKSKEELKNSNLLKYIKWGEKQKTKSNINWNNVPSVLGRKNWYDLGYFNKKCLLWSRIHNDSHRVYESNLFAADTFSLLYTFYDYDLTSAVLNSTFMWFGKEIYGRKVLGEGGLSSLGVDLVKIECIIINNINKAILKSFNLLKKRKIESIFIECGIDPSKPIREQTPKPLPDRAELDNIIFDELGLTKEERKEVYWAVCELVHNRLNKARSLKR